MAYNRQKLLGVLLASLLVLCYVVLSAILGIVIFSITVAYVLFPVRRALADRGLSPRLASAAATLLAFLAVTVVLFPVVIAIYQRRAALIGAVSSLPETVAIDFAGISTEIELAPVVESLTGTLRAFTLELAVAIPELLLGVAVFVFVVYGILYKPRAVSTAVYEVVPPDYHDILDRLHVRTRDTLYSIYVIQAATAFGTFLIAAVVFFVLGYESVLWLAFFAGLLQFLPVIGPSVLVLGLAGVDLVFNGLPARAAAVLVIGLLFIAVLPDLFIRPKLAEQTGDFSSTLYFVGFIGGILTVGTIGFILGPLVVALLVEVVNMLAEGTVYDHDRSETPSDA